MEVEEEDDDDDLFIHTYIAFCSVTFHRLTQENYTEYCHGINFTNRKLL